ncbi:MAG: methyltransferase domain-containing protein [Burkholderiaceae bacterium]
MASAVVSTVQGLWRAIVLAGRRALGLPGQLNTEDRRVLEQVILPEYASRPDISRILFVGCAVYTQQYDELFGDGEYWTIDPVARRRRYGSTRHIVDTLQNLGSHVAPEYFDLIVCNGVLGWGLNTPADAEAALAACFKHLRAGGHLLLGWNNIAPRNRVVPEDIPALRSFDRGDFGAGRRDRVEIKASNRHVFDFYRKRLLVTQNDLKNIA